MNRTISLSIVPTTKNKLAVTVYQMDMPEADKVEIARSWSYQIDLHGDVSDDGILQWTVEAVNNAAEALENMITGIIDPSSMISFSSIDTADKSVAPEA